MTAILKELPRKGPDPEMISILERALASALIGETLGILLIEKKSGSSAWSCAGIPDRFEVTGYLFHLAYKMQTDDNPLPRAGA